MKDERIEDFCMRDERITSYVFRGRFVIVAATLIAYKSDMICAASRTRSRTFCTLVTSARNTKHKNVVTKTEFQNWCTEQALNFPRSSKHHSTSVRFLHEMMLR